MELRVGNNGLLTWTERFVPSGMAALLLSTVHLWMILFDWWSGSRLRPTAGMMLGLGLGLIGIALLVLPSLQADPGSVDRLGVFVLLLAALSWAVGAMYSRQTDVPRSPLLGTALQMMTGGLWLLLVSLFTGEVDQLRLDSISLRSVLAVGYLILFGQLVGFTCYV